MKLKLTAVLLISIVVFIVVWQIRSPASTIQPGGEPRFGMTGPGPSQNGELYQLYLDSGAKITWWGLSWKDVAQNTSLWSKLNSDIDDAVNHGVTVVMQFKTGANWSKVENRVLTPGLEEWKANSPPKDLNEYRDFVSQMVEHFKGKVKYWEVLNEPYGTFLGSNDEYFELLRATYEAAHAADPDIKITHGGVASGAYIEAEVNDLLYSGKIDEAMNLFNWFFENQRSRVESETELRSVLGQEQDQRVIGYVNALFSNYSSYIDIYEFHSYNPYDKTIRVLNYIKSKMAQNGFEKPVRAKVGTLALPGVLVSENTRAKDVVRNFAVTLGNGVGKVLWFTMTDAENRSNGLVDAKQEGGSFTYAPKPAYYTYKLIVSKLEGFSSAENLNLDENIFAYKFIVDGKPIHVLWSSSNANLSLDLSTNRAKITNSVPDSQANFSVQEIGAVNGKITLALTETPLFVEEA